MFLLSFVRARYWYLSIVDGAVSILAVWLATSLRNEEWFIVTPRSYPILFFAGIGLPACLALRRCYSALDLAFSYQNAKAHLVAVGLYAVLFLTCCIMLYPTDIPRSVGLIQPMLVALFVVPPRLLMSWLDRVPRTSVSLTRARVFIYGAGSAGRFVLSSLRHNRTEVVGFIDDDPAKIGGVFHQVPVMASDHLPIATDAVVSEVILAIPSISGQRRGQIYDQLSAKGYSVMTVPTLVELDSSTSRIDQIRRVQIEDLLEREVVQPDRMLMRSVVEGQSVLITGAGGSIGSELSRQILKLNPHRLILFDHSEFQLFQIHQELVNVRLSKSVKIDPVLGSVTSAGDLGLVFEGLSVDVVFHAAAYKHVHLLERNDFSGLFNNVIGTKRLVDACLAHTVSKMVLVSTDKAVRPSSVMGMSKRVAEVVVEFARRSAECRGIKFSVVRFGNVLGSNGSVVPIFREQIAAGGPVTVTDPGVTRYFMTIPEAASLVIQAAGIQGESCLFVLDMGDPLSIQSLARSLIEMAGKVVTFSKPRSDGEIQIKFIGLKPGEKMHEDLFANADGVRATSHPRILEAPRSDLPLEMEEALTALISDIERQEQYGQGPNWSQTLSRFIEQLDR